MGKWTVFYTITNFGNRLIKIDFFSMSLKTFFIPLVYLSLWAKANFKGLKLCNFDNFCHYVSFCCLNIPKNRGFEKKILYNFLSQSLTILKKFSVFNFFHIFFHFLSFVSLRHLKTSSRVPLCVTVLFWKAINLFSTFEDHEFWQFFNELWDFFVFF